TFTAPSLLRSLAALAAPRASLRTFCTSETLVLPSWLTSQLLKVAARPPTDMTVASHKRRNVNLPVMTAEPLRRHRAPQFGLANRTMIHPKGSGGYFKAICGIRQNYRLS